VSDESSDIPPVVEGELLDLETSTPAPLPREIKTRRGFRRLENITVDDIEKFLTHLAKTGLILQSAESCGLSYVTVNRLKKDEPVFKEMCDEAMEAYVESLEAAAHSRAVDGWEEPVFSQKLGTEIGRIQRFDSRLLELMLKRHRPEFREKFEGEIKVSGGVLIAPIAAATPEQWAQQFGGERLTQYGDDQPALPPADGTPGPNGQ
jgi:hypothetical protein